MIQNWQYYNHAAVPTCASHEEPDLSAIIDGSIWRSGALSGGTPLFARYTTDFDCGYETSFWYVIKDSPFSLGELNNHYQKHVRKALERCEVKLIDKSLYEDELYEVYKAAYRGYKDADNELDKVSFIKELYAYGYDYWAAFSRDTGAMAGWMSCDKHDDWVGTVSAKYDPAQKKLFSSDAIHYSILTYYLNDLGLRFVNSGSRNINHKTNIQEYKINHWHFRPAYCHLHIEYNPKIRWIVMILYHFRKLLIHLDWITTIHQVNGILKMEEMQRLNRVVVLNRKRETNTGRK